MTNPDKKSSDYFRIKRKNLGKRVEILKAVITYVNETKRFKHNHYVLLYYPNSIRWISVKLTEKIPFLHYRSVGASVAFILFRVEKFMRSVVMDLLSKLIQASNARKNQNIVVQRAALCNTNSNRYSTPGLHHQLVNGIHRSKNVSNYYNNSNNSSINNSNNGIMTKTTHSNTFCQSHGAAQLLT